jgi:hypothetical protein
MNNPKEKAQELFNKMQSQTYSYQPYAGAHYNIEEIGWEAGKKCALIAVDEILDDDVYDMSEKLFEKRINYWEEVKQEIQRL